MTVFFRRCRRQWLKEPEPLSAWISRSGDGRRLRHVVRCLPSALGRVARPRPARYAPWRTLIILHGAHTVSQHDAAAVTDQATVEVGWLLLIAWIHFIGVVGHMLGVLGRVPARVPYPPTPLSFFSLHMMRQTHVRPGCSSWPWLAGNRALKTGCSVRHSAHDVVQGLEITRRVRPPHNS